MTFRYTKIQFFVFVIALSGCNQDKMPDFTLQGHRGCRGLMPENTIPAFLKALEYSKVSVLELDIVVSGDEKIVVSHEPWFNYVFASKPDGSPVAENDTFNLYRMTYDSIRTFDCGLRGHPRFPQQQKIAAVKPLLADVVKAVKDYCSDHNRKKPWYNIEIKSLPEWDTIYTPRPDSFAKLVCAELKQLDIVSHTVIQSFDTRVLQEVRRINPKIIIALLVEQSDLPMEFHLSQLGFIPEFYSPDFVMVDKALMDKARKIKIKVVPWTVNQPADIERMLALDVDGIITDYPDRGQLLIKK